MARDPAPPSPRRGLPYLHPWFLVGVGLGVMGLGWLVGSAFADPENPASWALPRLLLLFGGLFTIGTGLIRRFRRGTWEFPERIETAAMLSTSGLGCLAGYFGMDADWVSGRMLFAALFIISLLGVLLVLLPPLARRVAISLVVLFHFGGMAVAITSVDPPGGSGPYLSKQLWSKVYWPYLSFLYLTNAYHFYSPDPGPPTLFWFAICYDDGSYTWVKLPERANSPIHMHYQRMLALPEHSFAPQPRLPFNNYELALLGDNVPEDQRRRGSWEMIVHRRQVGSTRLYPLIRKEDGETIQQNLPIPLVVGVSETLQYREPQETSKLLLASVARRIFWRAPPSPNPGVKIKSVKLYRVTHQVLTPLELSQGMSPLEKMKHWGHFMGEFDGRGNLVDSLDPFLYWYLPIAYVAKDYPGNASSAPVIAVNLPKSKDLPLLLDCLEMHAAGEVRKAAEPIKGPSAEPGKKEKK